ncbi:MAG: hypothetical protein ACK4FB_04190 [Brevundimonas sp.]|uniref:hypothetical protein n=1 Tax=Brevundimonas sp. TaxID=1871086 RepID=UPI00391B251B
MTFLRTVLPVLAALTFPAIAQAQESSRPELLNRLTSCRTMGDQMARLSCYDAAVEALDAAEREGEVVVVDRNQVRESRQALFGFDLPSLPAFGRNAAAEEDISSLETTLSRASRGGDGKWVFRLTDGSVWRQVDSESVFFPNREGTEVRVRRASLGSFMMTVGSSRAIRVRRDQ